MRASEEQTAMRRHVMQLAQGFQAGDVEMLRFVKNKKHLAPGKIEAEIFKNPAIVTDADGASRFAHCPHELIGTDVLAAIDIEGAPSMAVLGDLSAIQLRDEMLENKTLLRSGRATEVIGASSVQRFIEVPAHQADVLRLIELAL